MIPITEQYKRTLTYSESSKGFPSFYSFNPEWIIGMNQFLYTFQGGNLFRHNTNSIRNNYYGQQFPARITSVFNERPLENKIFKTLNLESDEPWSATFTSDIQLFGEIASTYFEQKEGAWFAFLRSNSPTGGVGTTTATIPSKANLNMRSVNGIGTCTSFDTLVVNAIKIFFDINVHIGSLYNLGDFVYYVNPQTGSEPQFVGTLISKDIDFTAQTNTITINSTNTGTYPAPQPTFVGIPVNGYFFTLKNPIAESHGILGHYGIFELTLESTQASELFVVESETMKSFP